jgi:hypothetical protein
MSSSASHAPPRDLVWLRRIFTVFALLAVGSFARSYARHRGNFEHFDLAHSSALVLLGGGTCLAGWLGRWRAFVLLAIFDRAISGFGALVFGLNMALPGSYSVRGYPSYAVGNFASVVLSASILIYLLRKYPLNIEELSGKRVLPVALRCMQVGVGLVALAVAVDEWSSFARHWIEEGLHLHSCGWALSMWLLAMATAFAFVAGLFGRWRAFLSLGLVCLAITAFVNMTSLSREGLYAEWYGTPFAPVSLARNVVVFALAVFFVVYIAGRFPPVVRRGDGG